MPPSSTARPQGPGAGTPQRWDPRVETLELEPPGDGILDLGSPPPPLPAGRGSAAEANPALINYELKHFPSWLFTRAAPLLIRNNTMGQF